MNWLLRFIPFETIVTYLCSFIKERWTSKTETVVDDNAVDDVLKPALISWWACAVDPSITWQQTALSNALLAIDFLDETGLAEAEVRIKRKQEKLRQPVIIK